MCHIILHLSSLPHYGAHCSILTPGNFIMAYKALSEHVKRQKQSHLKHSKMHDIVNMYQHEQGKPIEECKGGHNIAEEHGIKKQWRTITNQYNDRQRKHTRHNRSLPLQKKRFLSTSLMSLQIVVFPRPLELHKYDLQEPYWTQL